MPKRIDGRRTRGFCTAMKLKELHEAKIPHDVDDRSVLHLRKKYTKGNFSCKNATISSLEGCPKEILGDFDCSSNSMTTLVGGPAVVGGDYDCSWNSLISLKGAPEIVGNFECYHNELTSFIGSPKKITGYLEASWNNLTSLAGIHLQINHIGGWARFSKNPIESHVLGLLIINGLNKVWLDNKEVQNIINKYLAGSRDVMDCQNELMDAGFDEYAQL